MQRSTLFEAVLVLLLIAMSAALFVAVTGSPGGEKWTLSGIIAAPTTNGFVPDDEMFGNLFVGEQGTLYSIDGQAIHAIAGNGSLLWSLEIPDYYQVTQHNRTYNEHAAGPLDKWNARSAVVRDGNLIVLVKPDNPANVYGVLLSVSPAGELLWSLPFLGSAESLDNYRYGFGDVDSVVLHGDVLYLYSQWPGLWLVDINGTIISQMKDLRGKPAIGDDGTIYVQNGSYIFDMHGHYSDPHIEAYGPNGTLLWRQGFDELGINGSYMIAPLSDNEPFLRNGTVFVWSNDGIVALNTDGSLRFRYNQSGNSFNGCGFGENGLLYLSFVAGNPLAMSMINGTSIVIIDYDGQVVRTQSATDDRYLLCCVRDLPGDLIFQVRAMAPYGSATNTSSIYRYTPYIEGLIIDYLKSHGGKWDYPRSLDDLNVYDITAYDPMTGKQLWSHTLPLKKCSVLLMPDNAGKVTLDEAAIAEVNKVPYDEWYATNGIPQGSAGIKCNSWAYLVTDNSTVYVDLWSYNYEYPPFYNRSKCVYAGGIYAYSLDGSLLWSDRTDSRVVSVQQYNGTIYYGTGGGKVSAARVGLVAGVLAALAYVFLRFFMLGSVSRARAALDKNDNRNRIVRYIAANPGASTFDISRELAINHGTARYHLLILCLNHRIISFRADEKYLRYFPNSGSYGPKDHLVISLMRREPLQKLLSVLLAKPGLSNMELSRVLGVPKSATMRSVKELVEKGIVVKSLLPDGKIAYSLSDEYREYTVSASELLTKNGVF
jgi:predicted transcriptional regulator